MSETTSHDPGVKVTAGRPVATSVRPSHGSERVLSSRPDLPAPSCLPGRNQRPGRAGSTDHDTTTTSKEFHR